MHIILSFSWRILFKDIFSLKPVSNVSYDFICHENCQQVIQAIQQIKFDKDENQKADRKSEGLFDLKCDQNVFIVILLPCFFKHALSFSLCFKLSSFFVVRYWFQA